VAAEVDFSRYSVLFASGRATNGIQQIFKTYEAQHEGRNLLTVELFLNDTEEAPLWNVALLVPALPEGAQVDLQVNAAPYAAEIGRKGGLQLPVPDLVLNEGWEWRTDEQTALYIIRSDVELISHMYKRKTNVKPADVDFTKNAILFVPGISSSNVARVDRTLYVGTRGFTLSIELLIGMLTVEEAWHVAVVVPNAVANSSIGFTVEDKFNK
jgi:hypothetical protein